MLHTVSGKVEPFESNMYILCKYLHICDDMNMWYLLIVIFRALVLFLGCRLSTESVVAHPLHLFPFSPSVKVLVYIEITPILYSLP